MIRRGFAENQTSFTMNDSVGKLFLLLRSGFQLINSVHLLKFSQTKNTCFNLAFITVFSSVRKLKIEEA